MSIPGLSAQTKVYLDFLGRLDVPKDDVDRLKQKISRDEGVRASDLKVDVYGRVRMTTLESAASALGISLPTGRLAALLRPSSSPTVRLPKGPYPEAGVSFSKPRVFEERMAEVTVDKSALGVFGARVESFLQSVSKKNEPLSLDPGVSQQALSDLLLSKRGAARQIFTPSELESLHTKLASLRGPAYEERDTEINLDSKFEPIHHGTGTARGVGVFRKAMLESLFLRRNAAGDGFDLHGFESEKIAVTLPKGHSVVIVDSAGHQRALRVQPKNVQIAGDTVRALEIDPSMIRPFGSDSDATDFTLRVVDQNKDPVLEQHLEFNAGVGLRSKKILSGQLSYPDKPSVSAGELSDHHFNHFVPDPKSNAAPAGERPRFQIGEGPATDQLVIQRDGERFMVNRWAQFGFPPGAKQQAVKLEGKKGVLLISHRGQSESHLDHPDYSPLAGFKLKDSYGHAFTLDPDLSQTRQARWDFRGLTLYEVSSATSHARCDPLRSK